MGDQSSRYYPHQIYKKNVKVPEKSMFSPIEHVKTTSKSPLFTTTSLQFVENIIQTVLKELDTNDGTSPQTYTCSSTPIENLVAEHKEFMDRQNLRIEATPNLFAGYPRCTKTQQAADLQCMHNQTPIPITYILPEVNHTVLQRILLRHSQKYRG